MTREFWIIWEKRAVSDFTEVYNGSRKLSLEVAPTATFCRVRNFYRLLFI